MTGFSLDLMGVNSHIDLIYSTHSYYGAISSTSISHANIISHPMPSIMLESIWQAMGNGDVRLVRRILDYNPRSSKERNNFNVRFHKCRRGCAYCIGLFASVGFLYLQKRPLGRKSRK